MSDRAAFLDRDGTINVKAPEGEYITSPDGFRFLPGAERAIRLLAGAGWRVIVVTNQRGVALGRMTGEDVAAVNGRMAHLPVDAVFVCPHDRGVCDCRKPGTGLFEQARERFPDIRFERSVVIGDADSDIAAGRAIGARTFRVGAPPLPSLLEVAQELAAPSDAPVTTA
jgi:D-glycero-D-manno-heptose 1,7-bisphosphate phosphatase